MHSRAECIERRTKARKGNDMREHGIMPYSQYCRIESIAGGVFASDRDFVRAALSLFRPEKRYCRELREVRHEWLMDGLRMMQESRDLNYHVMSGRR